MEYVPGLGDCRCGSDYVPLDRCANILEQILTLLHVLLVDLNAWLRMRMLEVRLLDLGGRSLTASFIIQAAAFVTCARGHADVVWLVRLPTRRPDGQGLGQL